MAIYKNSLNIFGKNWPLLTLLIIAIIISLNYSGWVKYGMFKTMFWHG